MASGKARFTGKLGKTKDFSENLRQKLKAYYPGDEDLDPIRARVRADMQAGFNSVRAATQTGSTSVAPILGDEADAFVVSVLHEAEYLTSQLAHDSLFLKREDLKAELAMVLKTLTKCEEQMRTLSREIEIRLKPDVWPRDVANELKRVRDEILAARPTILSAAPTITKHQFARAALVEMTVRVLKTLKEHGIRPSATAGEHGPSQAVQILKLIAEDVGIDRDEATWKRIIQDAKKTTKELK